jgi:hypothetical protein
MWLVRSGEGQAGITDTPHAPHPLVERDEELAAVGVWHVLVGARDQPAVAEAQAAVELVPEGLAVD